MPSFRPSWLASRSRSKDAKDDPASLTESLPTFALSSLSDEAGVADLLSASQTLGAFYLDLRCPSPLGTLSLSISTALLSLGRALFALSDDEKRLFDMARWGGYYGYKGYANDVGDRKEFYTLAKDDVLSISQHEPAMPRPDVLSDDNGEEMVKEYVVAAHEIVNLVLKGLSGVLGLEGGALEGLHRRDEKSGDQVRWIRIRPGTDETEERVLLDEHTDSNSVTVLFNSSSGLQIGGPTPSCSKSPCSKMQNQKETQKTTPISIPALEKNSDGNRWIRADPRPGHCIVLFGEQMAKLTHGACRASVHRVVRYQQHSQSDDADEDHARYSLIYFARLEDEAVLRQLAGVSVVPRPTLSKGPDKGSAWRKLVRPRKKD